MSTELSNNRRIAKNTLLLYLRMILVLIVSLYTSRVVLKTLGISDYGIYSVVGGFVSMLAYLNSVFVSSTQRFMSYALGKCNRDAISSTFSTAKTIHILIAIIILVIAETFGLWFVNQKLVIEANRMIAANWVYQCSIFSLLFTILSIPFNSSIVAHEHMHVYAYIGILEVFLKLGILFLLLLFDGDKIIIYAILHASISCFVFVSYILYCKKHFEECSATSSFNKPLFREMFAYAGWTTVGNLGFSFKDQFSNIILNIFFGTTINAARGIAIQVNSAITSFSTNFFMAISPQIIKQYASGNLVESQKLVYAGARYSFFLITVLTIPILLNLDYILSIWLDIVPKYTSSFLKITLLSSVIYSLTNSVSTAIQATGKIREFQIGVSIIMLLELPAAYLILKAGYEPPYALLPLLFTTSIALVYRFFLLKKLIPSYSLRRYYIETVLKCVVIFIVCLVSLFFINKLMPNGFLGLVLSAFVSVVVLCAVIYFAGINSKERALLKQIIANKVFHKSL